jgi:hypothetical protein
MEINQTTITYKNKDKDFLVPFFNDLQQNKKKYSGRNRDFNFLIAQND